MVMINCPECNAEISGSTLKCPKCGYQINKLKRGVFGKIIKWSFILFNILMLLWIMVGIGGSIEGIKMMNELEQAGVEIGTGLGAIMIMKVWVIGDIVFGLFVLLTRPKL
jgi:uncharacterized paraquat-inducible protein A